MQSDTITRIQSINRPKTRSSRQAQGGYIFRHRGKIFEAIPDYKLDGGAFMTILPLARLYDSSMPISAISAARLSPEKSR